MNDQPQVEHWCVFGCEALCSCSKDERKKLDSKLKNCVFLGYEVETKGY